MQTACTIADAFLAVRPDAAAPAIALYAYYPAWRAETG